MPSHTPIIPSRDAGLDTPVRSFMRPGVVTVSEDASLRQAQRAMISHGIRAVLVTARQRGRPLGWVTAQGIVERLHQDLGLVPASAAVTETATTIEPGATAADAAQLLGDPNITHLLVSRTPDGPAQGVISDLDLIRLSA